MLQAAALPSLDLSPCLLYNNVSVIRHRKGAVPMERLIDLHVHSDCSDGTLSPEELVIHAHEQRLYAIALTDHDTIAGIERAKKS